MKIIKVIDNKVIKFDMEFDYKDRSNVNGVFYKVSINNVEIDGTAKESSLGYLDIEEQITLDIISDVVNYDLVFNLDEYREKIDEEIKNIDANMEKFFRSEFNNFIKENKTVTFEFNQDFKFRITRKEFINTVFLKAEELMNKNKDKLFSKYPKLVASPVTVSTETFLKLIKNN